MRPLFLSLFFILGFSFFSCKSPAPLPEAPEAEVEEIAPRNLPLAGPIAEAAAEISGLAWHGDYLILLPQYPDFPRRGGGGRLFALTKQEILAPLAVERMAPLQPREVRFNGPDLKAALRGFEGYEAIVFDPDTTEGRAWLTIEVEPGNDGAFSYLLRGNISPDLSTFKVDTLGMVRIPSQSGVENMTEETLLLCGQKLATLHEANGLQGGNEAFAHLFDPNSFQVLPQISLPPIPFRITDATNLDAQGRFWVINMFYPGEQELAVVEDPIVRQFGQGPTHRQHEKVERLLELQYSPKGITLSGRSPIQLELSPGLRNSRNWEGIARLDSLGLLIVTDKFPGTMLGFVPFPN